MTYTDNECLKRLTARTAVFSTNTEIKVEGGQSNSLWTVLPNASPRFANLRAPKNLPASVTSLTFRLRNDKSDIEGNKLFANGVERAIALPEAGIIIEPNELTGLSAYLNGANWQVQIRLNDVVLADTLFYLDAA